MQAKFNSIRDRLTAKIKMSKTPVPGMLVSLSGTDSIIAFMIAEQAARYFELQNGYYIPVRGIHYVNAARRQPTWFEEHIVPYLRDRYSHSEILVEEPLGGNEDHQRWADLHTRALNSISAFDGKTILHALEPEQRSWLVGTMNATEKRLGTYSVLSTTVSIQPIQSLWKSEILELCRLMNVPEIAMEYARIPDCFCGRDEIAAENIEMIDDILRNRFRVMGDTNLEIANEVLAYIEECTRMNDFKNRIPYVV